jgi:hypothetical protein
VFGDLRQAYADGDGNDPVDSPSLGIWGKVSAGDDQGWHGLRVIEHRGEEGRRLEMVGSIPAEGVMLWVSCFWGRDS